MTSKEEKEYKKHREMMNKVLQKEALQSYYESVKNNKDLFDREYYIEQLKKKGFEFPDE